MATRVAGRVRTAPKKSSSPLKKFIKRTLWVASGFFFLGGSGGGFLLISEMQRAQEKIKDLPERLSIINTSDPTIIFAADRKTVLYRAAPVYRKPIGENESIPKWVEKATLAAEDKRFFDHGGVDYIAAARSIVTNVREGKSSQGGSTITMQLMKRLYTNSEKTWRRKISDVCMAVQMERQYSKEAILRNYLNEIFYGQGAYGIKAAAQVYFGKAIDRLTPAEAALIARCVRRPSDENPFVDLDKAIENRNVVLKTMRDEGWLTQAEFEHAKKEKVNLREKSFAGTESVEAFPYFTHYVLDYLKDNLPDLHLEEGGYKIYTTIDPEVQRETEKAVKYVVDRNSRMGVKTASFVLMDNTGQIRAMQGGVDYDRNQFNMVTQGTGRQPGSSMKPFIYAAALSTGAISPGDRISNESFDLIPGWHPQNSGGGAGGSYSISEAIAQSKNLPAVWVTYKVGPEVAAKYCRDVFGFSHVDPVMSMALGTNDATPLEMAEGYSVFMTGGDRVVPRPVTQITGPTGETFKRFAPQVLKYQLDARVAQLMDGYLEGVVDHGTGTRAKVISDSRGKTGTTQDNKDAWFAGYTNNMVGIGWVGNEQLDPKTKRWVYRPMNSRAFGGTITVNIWTRVLKVAQAKYGRGSRIEGEALSRDVGVDVTNRQPERDERPEETPVTQPQDDESTKAQPEETKTRSQDPPATQEEPPKRNEERTRREEERPPVEESIGVEICADTGMKATIYCPETVTKQFGRGQAPRRWCRKHSQ